MWWDSLKSLRKIGEYMSSSFLTSWMKGVDEPVPPKKKQEKKNKQKKQSGVDKN